METSLPAEYTAFLAKHGAFEGFFNDGEDVPGYIVLWRLDELSGYNRDIEISEYAPGYLAFAGNGGGEVFVFDASGAVFMLPMIGMAGATAIRVAGSFSELAAKFELAA